MTIISCVLLVVVGVDEAEEEENENDREREKAIKIYSDLIYVNRMLLLSSRVFRAMSKANGMCQLSGRHSGQRTNICLNENGLTHLHIQSWAILSFSHCSSSFAHLPATDIFRLLSTKSLVARRVYRTFAECRTKRIWTLLIWHPEHIGSRCHVLIISGQHTHTRKERRLTIGIEN